MKIYTKYDIICINKRGRIFYENYIKKLVDILNSDSLRILNGASQESKLELEGQKNQGKRKYDFIPDDGSLGSNLVRGYFSICVKNKADIEEIKSMLKDFTKGYIVSQDAVSNRGGISRVITYDAPLGFSIKRDETPFFEERIYPMDNTNRKDQIFYHQRRKLINRPARKSIKQTQIYTNEEFDCAFQIITEYDIINQKVTKDVRVYNEDILNLCNSDKSKSLILIECYPSSEHRIIEVQQLEDGYRIDDYSVKDKTKEKELVLSMNVSIDKPMNEVANAYIRQLNLEDLVRGEKIDFQKYKI